MPIDQDQWEAGEEVSTSIDSVRNFLEESHPEAYTAEEITGAVLEFASTPPVTSEKLRDIAEQNLEILIETGSVEARRIETGDRRPSVYYRAVDE
ncbi:hypothetical protein [Halococcus sp. IIIV-5B]|uniref:hypothetical protein n=1 Tax=Halococcus sp. IIIV-5B TaxID=2321230 RepID=UPI000E757E79|nr:hypothetical protein [Halococcus sp. IIIV-5B]RJT04423.1 hypothetical protein D3261_09665 [Halococcus sp. IIIV-5B]